MKFYKNFQQKLQACMGGLFLCLILSACDGGDGTNGQMISGGLGTSTNIPGTQAPGTQTTPSTQPPVQPTAQAPNATDTGDCTYTLSSDITSPTNLENTAAYCDYELSGWVEVRSLLTIEPGVVVRAGPDSRIVVEGGEIQAVGTAQNRIVFEGASHVQGYWSGIAIRFGRPTVFDYVDIKDAGQVCSIIFCPDVGFIAEDVTLSFTNSSVSNSYVIGMSITDSVDLRAFSNNRFFGNASFGLAVYAEGIPLLDTASDYRGIGNENGVTGVAVGGYEQTSGGVFQWKKLNTPYLITGYFNVYGGILRLDPGVEILFGDGAWMTIEDNGVFQALGTAAEPVVLRGYQPEPGYWEIMSYCPIRVTPKG